MYNHLSNLKLVLTLCTFYHILSFISKLLAQWVGVGPPG